jgi:hypothetical protein
MKSVEPGNKMEIKIVAAGYAAPQLRRRCESRAEKDDRRPGELSPNGLTFSTF